MTTDRKYAKCNLCGSGNFRTVYKKKFREEKHAVESRYSASGGKIGMDNIVKCRECGLVYINPRFESKVILDAYYGSEDKRYASQDQGRIYTFKKGIKLIGNFSKKGRILDVGCASGFFLKAAKDKGWDVYGVEPSKWFVDYAKEKYKIDVTCGTIFDTKYEDNFFDVITIWDVLEHTDDPMAVLNECSRVLKKGGILLINYPDISSLPSLLFRDKWWFVLSSHLYYFAPGTIGKMLAKTGLKPKYWGIHLQYLNLAYVIGMFGLYSKGLLKIAEFFSRLFRLERFMMVYYGGQRNVISVKQ